MAPGQPVDYNALAQECVQWIKEWFARNGGSSPKAVLGMSGGKDSTVAAALCAKALGPENVVGVAMPAEGQSLHEADEICAFLGIRYICAPVGDAIASFESVAGALEEGISPQARQNIPPRVRMTALYAISQSLGGRVVNTCNLSEDYIGYATRWGDSVGDFSPMGGLTVQEVKGIGHALGVPSRWVEKTPDDGLPCSCPDEEKFGFTYAVLDRYIRTGECDDPAVREKIDRMHRSNVFKLSMPEAFRPFD